MSAKDAEAARPSLSLLGTEPLRAALEYARHRLSERPPAPNGYGHQVILFPGLGSDDAALVPLRDYCNSLGYHAMDWQMGRNTGLEGDLEDWLDSRRPHARVDGAQPEARDADRVERRRTLRVRTCQADGATGAAGDHAWHAFQLDG